MEIKKPEYVVGVGASAGGLEALQYFFSDIPSENALAFVVIQHLSPDFKSLMDQLLQKYTNMKIVTVESETVIQRDTIYLIPPKKNMIIENESLILQDQIRGHHLNLPIDLCFISLAKCYQDKAIGVVLSGTGSDGANGIIEIANNGGLVIAQLPESAQFDGMPRSAINTQLVNKILAPQQMGNFITEYISNPIRPNVERRPGKYDRDGDVYNQIFELLMDKFNIDFSLYKESTIYRRIDRRIKAMLLGGEEEYVNYIKKNEMEVDLLYSELLIGVTAFFRDEEAFEELEINVIPKIFEQCEKARRIRVWISACSTGEEVYSVAILFKEHLAKLKIAYDIKIFASDVNQRCLDHGARGQYSESSMAGVSQERRDRFFVKRDDTYTIIPDLRSMIVFAPQNLTMDPPFTNLDLITCRNFLIYLKPEAQESVIQNFHFALRGDGFLFLGPSESLGNNSDHFIYQSRPWKIYKSNGVTAKKPPLRSSFANRVPKISHVLNHIEKTRNRIKRPDNYGKKRIYDLILDHELKDSVIVDEKYNVVHTTGFSTDLLSLKGGEVNYNILELIKPDLKAPLATVLHRAKHDKTNVLLEKINVNLYNENKSMDIEVSPIGLPQGTETHPNETFLFIVRFKNLHIVSEMDTKNISYSRGTADQNLIDDLEAQLNHTKEELQAALEEAEVTNEELQSTNEELLASNEELQSTNEELHSVNEELYTVNSEHQNKIEELEELNEDVDYMVHSEAIGSIFLDDDRNIRRITPTIVNNFNILSIDLGRPIENYLSQFNCPNLGNYIRLAQENGKKTIVEGLTNTNIKILIKVIPNPSVKYKRGVVLTMSEFSEIVEIEGNLKDYSSRLKSILNTQTELSYHITHDLMAISKGYFEIFENLKKYLDDPNEDKSKFDILNQDLESVIKSLRTFSSVNFPLDIKSVDIPKIYQSNILKLKKDFPGAKFIIEFLPEYIEADEGVFDIILKELLKNAVQHNTNESKIIRISSIDHVHFIEFTINDNGQGISKDQHERIFQIFTVLGRPSGSIERRGEGIGLAIVKKGVEMLGGKVWVTGGKEFGCTFHFTVPKKITTMID